MSQAIRIVIASPPGLGRAGLCALLATQADFAVVAEVASGDSVPREVQRQRADVLVLDRMCSASGGLDVLRGLKAATVSVPTLVLASVADRSLAVEALQLGASGVVLKESTPELLFRAVRGVSAGEAWVDRETVSMFLRRMREQAASGHLPPSSRLPAILTSRELAIVREVAGGASNRDIALKHGLSEQTVKNHLHNIFDKVGVSTRLELAVRALHDGLNGEQTLELRE